MTDDHTKALDDANATIQAQAEEIRQLRLIRDALIDRVETSRPQQADPYGAFQHSAILAKQVRERTDALNSALHELQQSNQALAQANQSKSRYLAAISHDLMQPLNAARLFTEAMHEAPSSGSNYLTQISHALDDLESLIHSLVDISRLDAGIMPVRCEEQNLLTILQPLAEEFRMTFDRQGLSFASRLRSAWVYTDAALLTRILRNLAGNALRYTEQGGALLAVRIRQQQVWIDIWDTGMGIPADQLRPIFDEFHRGKNSVGRGERGLGLGLSIVQRIAGLLGIEVNCLSREGKGSCFRLKLALRSATQTTKAEENSQPIAEFVPALMSAAGTPSIGIVDDDVAVCAAMKALLQSWGFRVVLLPLELEPLKQNLKQLKPALMLVDYHLGNQRADGLTLVKRLKEQGEWMPPLIMMSAAADETLRQYLYQNQLPFVGKPVKAPRLRLMLSELVRSMSEDIE
ncbi:ATP-binding protein [Pokkaliibacter sp. CJK22405]|uniref:ATP-binding response regulator n=1 Tax=Pokkaliibacter sp. CJK22405 TaxID=3384615 RepID=UPI0039849795